jgi:hypothetical protein
MLMVSVSDGTVAQAPDRSRSDAKHGHRMPCKPRPPEACECHLAGVSEGWRLGMGRHAGFAGPGRILAAGEVGEASPTARPTPVSSEIEPQRTQDLTKRVLLPGAIDSPENQALPSLHLQRGALALLAANSFLPEGKNHSVLAVCTGMRIGNGDTKFLLSRINSDGERNGLRPSPSTPCLSVGQRARHGNAHAAEFLRGRYPSRADPQEQDFGCLSNLSSLSQCCHGLQELLLLTPWKGLVDV